MHMKFKNEYYLKKIKQNNKFMPKHLIHSGNLVSKEAIKQI